MARTVAVVGAGLTGATCTALLYASGVDVTLFERGRAVGGRLASPELFGRRVDLGASYFTVSDSEFGEVVSEWRRAGLARAWTDTFEVIEPVGRTHRRTGKAAGPMRWATPGGTRSLVRQVLGDVDASRVELGRPVEVVAPRAGETGPGESGPAIDGTVFDAVVLAMPDPQALRVLTGTSKTAARLNDERVDFEPALAVAAQWPRRSWTMTDGAFVNSHPVLSFVADDGARRGDGAPVLVAHTTPGFAREHLADPDAAVQPVLAALADVLELDARPAESHVHRWTFAKPATAHATDHLHADEGIVVAGDAWCPSGSPRVESAWLSGRAAARAVLAELGR